MYRRKYVPVLQGSPACNPQPPGCTLNSLAAMFYCCKCHQTWADAPQEVERVALHNSAHPLPPGPSMSATSTVLRSRFSSRRVGAASV